jgi:hypothetical protein
MSKKNHTPGPVPAGNRPKAGPAFESPDQEQEQDESGKTAGPKDPTGQEQDPQRRLGNYTGAGEHSRQQPGAANDGDKASK